MSPTRKPKPPDKGAPPEHKPSRKVALEEVMRSLQDLVSNELAIEPAKSSGGAPPAASKTPRRATVTPPAADSAAPETLAAEASLETDTVPLEGLPDPAAATPNATLAPPPTTENTVPTGGLQQELPYLDALSPAPTASPSETTEAPPVLLAPEELPALTSDSDIGHNAPDVSPTEADAGRDASTDSTAASTAEAAPAPRMEINWDDIPVLDEAVEMPGEIEVHETGHALDGPAATNLPPADAARRLAIQVAARLNVELRKSGHDGLNSDIITRLARLLQEALAKGAPNMENTTARDGGNAERGAVPTGTNAGAVFRPPPDKH